MARIWPGLSYMCLACDAPVDGLREPPLSDSRYQSTLDAVYVYAVPWSEFPFVPSYPHYPHAARMRRAQRSAPNTSHPAPYTRHPTPYTPHSTPDTLHPTPYTLHPTPYALHPAPYTLHPPPSTLHHIPYTPHPSGAAFRLTVKTFLKLTCWVCGTHMSIRAKRFSLSLHPSLFLSLSLARMNHFGVTPTPKPQNCSSSSLLLSNLELSDTQVYEP